MTSPLVRPVFVALAAFHGGVDVVKASGYTVPQLVAQMHPFLNAPVPDAVVQADEAFPAVQHDGHGAVTFYLYK